MGRLVGWLVDRDYGDGGGCGKETEGEGGRARGQKHL
jgi:hypothetical protein